jgi:NAD-dependent deacetylase
MSDEALIQQAAEILRGSKDVAVLTGAGVSKESGVPTFRDALDGLWAQYDPQELATPMAFKRNPKLVWDWYTFRRELVSKARPNPGHIALAQLEAYFPAMCIITQNVDDLHEQAGSANVIHLHGNIARSKCSANCQGNPTLIDLTQLEYDETPPQCPHCRANVRPDVVWFHEVLPNDALQDASAVTQRCDMMLVVGTSGLVTPAATLPSIARQHGAKIIEVNPDETPITPIADIKLSGPSGEMLPLLVEALAANA